MRRLSLARGLGASIEAYRGASPWLGAYRPTEARLHGSSRSAHTGVVEAMFGAAVVSVVSGVLLDRAHLGSQWAVGDEVIR